MSICVAKSLFEIYTCFKRTADRNAAQSGFAASPVGRSVPKPKRSGRRRTGIEPIATFPDREVFDVILDPPMAIVVGPDGIDRYDYNDGFPSFAIRFSVSGS